MCSCPLQSKYLNFRELNISWKKQLMAIAYIMYQVLMHYDEVPYKLITHIANTANFKTNDLKPNERVPIQFALPDVFIKNVLEEHDAPDQSLLGLMIPTFSFCWHCQYIWKHGWKMAKITFISFLGMPWMMVSQQEARTNFTVS